MPKEKKYVCPVCGGLLKYIRRDTHETYVSLDEYGDILFSDSDIVDSEWELICAGDNDEQCDLPRELKNMFKEEKWAECDDALAEN